MSTATERPIREEFSALSDRLWSVHDELRERFEEDGRAPFWWGAIDDAVSRIGECNPKIYAGKADDPRCIDTGPAGKMDLFVIADVLESGLRHMGPKFSAEEEILWDGTEELRSLARMMGDAEISSRLSDLRSTLLSLDHSLELAVGEADDLAARGAVSRSEVADPLNHARRSVNEALAIENPQEED